MLPILRNLKLYSFPKKVNKRGGVRINMVRDNSKGFTLVELLIVIVIIGILAGVLIAVINPSQQTNRARDAGVQASMNKVSLATEGFISAYGRSPNGVEFITGLQNATVAPVAGAGCTAAVDFCLYSVTGNNLPTGVAPSDGCDGGRYAGTGANQCYFRFERLGGATGTGFNIYGKSFGLARTVFKYNNSAGTIRPCADTAVGAGTPTC